MDFLTRFLSFEKPMGNTLVRVLYYLAIVAAVWNALKMFWHYGILRLDNDWGSALWVMIKTPFILIFGIIVLRVAAELALAVLRMDTSLHKQANAVAAEPETIDAKPKAKPKPKSST